MDERFTIVIVPHSRTNVRKYQISSRILSFVFVSLAVLVLVSAGLMVHYVKIYRQAWDLKGVEMENAQLKASLEQSQLLTQKLNRKISSLTELSNKLKLLAGLPAQPPMQAKKQTQSPGIGGVTMNPTVAGAPDPQRLLSMEKRADYLEKSFTLLDEYFQKQHLELSYTPSILPAQGFISSFFGARRNPFTNSPDFHEGIDITNGVGTSVICPADGRVYFTGQKGNYGLVVEIRHDDSTTTLFGHLAKSFVKPGDRVKRWQPIAMMGNSGKSTGPHLHYEVHLNDQPVNPLPYILDLASLDSQ
jgi:murein DD-endopeptidase MepM/ murein hydrolase activator NlpD